MHNIAIKVENLSKRYRLGQIGGGTLSGDLNRWWAQIRRKPDPTLKIGQEDQSNSSGEYIWALRDISFEVQQGEVLGIIGRNGAGKSTLLKVLSRITAPTNGKVKVRGQIASLLEVGTGFHPELTGRENIYLNGAILGMKRTEIERRFDEIVDFSGVEQFIDTPVKRYSSGMSVRLAFAVAAHLEPDVLLVDEVLAVGDAAFQKKCLGKMGEVAQQGRTVLFVSHNMASVNRLCPRALWIKTGQIMMDDQTEQIVSCYLSRGTSVSGEHLWPHGVADGGVEEINVYSVRILNRKEEVTSILDIREPFWVEIDYCLQEAVPYCRVGVIVDTVQGVRVFETYDADSKQYAGLRDASHYKSRCQVSDRLLNPGRYVLSINIGIPGVKKLALLENILVFDIEDPGAIDSPLYSTRKGILFPKFHWEVEKDLL